MHVARTQMVWYSLGLLCSLALRNQASALPIQFPARVLGMNYDPNPLDYTQGRLPPQLYYDSDFFHGDFAPLWGGGAAKDGVPGRNDLQARASADRTHICAPCLLPTAVCTAITDCVSTVGGTLASRSLCRRWLSPESTSFAYTTGIPSGASAALLLHAITLSA